MSIRFTYTWGFSVSPLSGTVTLDAVPKEVFNVLPGRSPFRISITKSDFEIGEYRNWIKENGPPSSDLYVDEVTFSIREPAVIRSVPKCARCGSMHFALPFTRIKGKVTGVEGNYWTTCPQTGDPLLVHIDEPKG